MPELPEGKTIVINEQEFLVSYAETGMELTVGLKGIVDLDPFVGMLFDFGQTMPVIMTSSGCLIDLDVAFISSAGRIEEIKVLKANSGFTQASTSKVYYALEVPVGFFEQNGISVGDTVTKL